MENESFFISLDAIEWHTHQFYLYGKRKIILWVCHGIIIIM